MELFESKLIRITRFQIKRLAMFLCFCAITTYCGRWSPSLRRLGQNVVGVSSLRCGPSPYEGWRPNINLRFSKWIKSNTCRHQGAPK